MREIVYATLILHKCNKDITENNIKRILDAVGIKVDNDEIKKLVEGVNNIDLDMITKSVMPITVITPIVGEVPIIVERKKRAIKDKDITGMTALFGNK